MNDTNVGSDPDNEPASNLEPNENPLNEGNTIQSQPINPDMRNATTIHNSENDPDIEAFSFKPRSGAVLKRVPKTSRLNASKLLADLVCKAVSDGSYTSWERLLFLLVTAWRNLIELVSNPNHWPR